MIALFEFLGYFKITVNFLVRFMNSTENSPRGGTPKSSPRVNTRAVSSDASNSNGNLRGILRPTSVGGARPSSAGYVFVQICASNIFTKLC